MKKTYIKMLSSIALVATICTSSLPVLADSTSDIQNLNDQISSIETQISSLNTQIDDKNKELSTTNSEIDKRTKIIDNVNSKLNSTEQRKDENISNLADSLTTKLIESKTKSLISGNDEVSNLTLHPVSFSVLENKDTNILNVDMENSVLTETSKDLSNEKQSLEQEQQTTENSTNELIGKKTELENEISDLNNKIKAIQTRERIREKYGIDVSGKNSDVIETSLQYLGVNYVWGGTSPQGFDCSGLVQYVYAQHGVYLPRTTYEQENVGTRVSGSDLQPGDLLFYGAPSHHVTMYIGNGRMIEAPRTGDVVKISPVRSYTQARRVR